MIREAVAADMPTIVDMGQRFRRLMYADQAGENLAQMVNTANYLMESPSGLLLVAEHEEHLVGMIGMLLFHHHISGEQIAGEVFWWTEPTNRGVGVRLLKRAEAWAADHHADRIQMVAPNLTVGELYERLGYAPIEVGYQKRVA